MSEPIGSESVRFKWLTPKEFEEETQKILESFTQGHRPPDSLPEPTGTIVDDIQARQESIKNILQLEQEIKAAHASKRAGLMEKMQKIGTFAANHPFLSMGFLVGLLMVAVTGYLTFEALLGHQTIALFHMHPELGGGLTFMMIYYSIYLISLCRQAAIKDEETARIKMHEEFRKELTKSRTHNLKDLASRMNIKTFKLAEDYLAMEQDIQKTRSIINQELDTARKSLQEIKEYQKSIFQLIEAHAYKMPTATAESVAVTFIKMCAIIRSGEEELLANLPEITKVPGILKLEFEDNLLDFSEKNEMSDNVKKLARFKKAMTSFFKNIRLYLKNNPGSVSLMAGGLLMCILTGLAFYFYAKGASDIYFFGELSLVTIAPMAIYGFSLIYEGYSNSSITSLQQKLKELEQEDVKEIRELTEELNRLENIKKQTAKTFEKFQNEWLQFLKLESHSNMEMQQKIQDKQLRVWEETKALAEKILEIIKPIYKDFPVDQTKSHFLETARFVMNLSFGTKK
jgi:hypothetical protein